MTAEEVFAWLRIDLNSAMRFHADQADSFSDPGNIARERGRAEMASTILERLDACEAGMPPVHYTREPSE